jgi:hypothetical protein
MPSECETITEHNHSQFTSWQHIVSGVLHAFRANARRDGVEAGFVFQGVAYGNAFVSEVRVMADNHSAHRNRCEYF